MRKNIARVSSALKAVELRQEPPPLIIGERLNTQGSRKAKEMVLKNDFEGLVNLARTQVDDGAHCLDVCVATTERSDESDFMKTLVKRLSLEIEAPLVIDSTDPKVIKTALEQIPGKPIINSINLEGDGSKFHSLAPLMVRYGVPAIAMCIGPNGMAKTTQEKLETANLLYNTGKAYGLQPWQFIFDVLTFTLATGESEFMNSAKATLEGIRLVKQNIPGCFTTLGLSNVSFGLPAKVRKIVNSVFLYHAVKAGLDTVIINAKDIIAYSDIEDVQRRLAEDLIFNRNSNALGELISYFEELESRSSSSSSSSSSIKPTDVDPRLTPDQRCYFRIVNRLKDGIEQDVIEAIYSRVKGSEKNELIEDRQETNITFQASKEDFHNAAVQTLNGVLLPAMKEVGDKFGSGELILPFVLKSAECMKAAVAELEKYLIRQEGVSKGRIVLCTVYGDVHDIGKNLVKTIFVNNGYTVYDLGKQVPLQKIVEKIKETNSDAVGLSALLVSTSKQMQYFIEYAKQNNLNIPVLCGGAAINSSYINRIATEAGIYNSGVFYCKTAFEGLKVVNSLMSQEKEQFMLDWQRKTKAWEDRQIQAAQHPESYKIVPPVSNIKPIPPPTPPHINKQVRLGSCEIDLNKVWNYINKKSLFVLSWGIRGQAAHDFTNEAEKLFLYWKEKVLDEKLFEPRAVYGYFSCHNRDGKLSIDPPIATEEEVIFEFPRSSKEKHLCLTDYFGPDDIVCFQAVTVGNKVTEIIDEWNKQNRYTDAYYLHGLAVETAEALAEWLNSIIRSELQIGHNRGLRYSWGYPSCPDISQHHLVWKLLHPEKSGMSLTESGQIIPDQSTAAIIVHHPEAEYFVL
jgi:5-methyltetrahydrofolate--homocysteine methyltransferase